MNTKRTTLYLSALLICGVALGTLLSVQMLGKPFEYAWVTVAHNDDGTSTNTNANANTNTAIDVSADWQYFTVRSNGAVVGYPVGWQLWYNSELARPTNASPKGSILYMSPEPLDDTPRGGSVAPIILTFVRNSSEADVQAAVTQFRNELTSPESTTVTYNDIAWTRVTGMEDLFGSAVPATGFFARLPQAGSTTQYTLVTAQLGYAQTSDSQYAATLTEIIEHLKAAE